MMNSCVCQLQMQSTKFPAVAVQVKAVMMALLGLAMVRFREPERAVALMRAVAVPRRRVESGCLTKSTAATTTSPGGPKNLHLMSFHCDLIRGLCVLFLLFIRESMHRRWWE